MVSLMKFEGCMHICIHPADCHCIKLIYFQDRGGSGRIDFAKDMANVILAIQEEDQNIESDSDDCQSELG